MTESSFGLYIVHYPILMVICYFLARDKPYFRRDQQSRVVKLPPSKKAEW